MLIYKIFNYIFNKRIFLFYIFAYYIYKYVFEIKDILLYKKNILPGYTVVDGGANIGFFTLLYSKLVGKDGLVIAFEPDPINFLILKKRTIKRKNIILVRGALSDKSGKIRLYRSKDLNVDHQAYKTDENRKFLSVNAYSLDEYIMNKFPNNNVDIIKLDLQGYDPIAINGMKKIMESSKGTKVFFEFWPHGMKQAGVNPTEWIDSLKKYNYKIEGDISFDLNAKNYTTLIIQKI